MKTSKRLDLWCGMINIYHQNDYRKTEYQQRDLEENLGINEVCGRRWSSRISLTMRCSGGGKFALICNESERKTSGWTESSVGMKVFSSSTTLRKSGRP
jgi:hypothetical protein